MIAKWMVSDGGVANVALEAESDADSILLRSLRLDYEAKGYRLAILGSGASPAYKGNSTLIIGVGSRPEALQPPPATEEPYDHVFGSWGRINGHDMACCWKCVRAWCLDGDSDHPTLLVPGSQPATKLG